MHDDSLTLICYGFLQDGSSGSGFDDDNEEGDCPDGSYFCNSSAKCILESSLCDRINDCGDWEDESQSECGGKQSIK